MGDTILFNNYNTKNKYNVKPVYKQRLKIPEADVTILSLHQLLDFVVDNVLVKTSVLTHSNCETKHTDLLVGSEEDSLL